MSTYMFIYIYIYLYLYSYVYTFVGPPVNQCGEHWSGGPGSLVRGAKEKLYTPDRLSVCAQNLVRRIFVRNLNVRR